MARLLWMVCLVWAEFAAANIPAHRPVSGALPAPASSVTVNGQSAERYGDFSFARTNLSLTGNDTFTIIAQNQFGSATNSASYNLPASVALKWDANGNLTNDGTRAFFYDAQNRLTNVTVETKWKTEFVHDGLGRRRMMREYGWQGGQWVKTNEVRLVCDGMLPIQERDGNNLIKVSYARGPDLSGSLQGAGGIGGLLARTDSAGNSLFFHADGAGNITALMDMPGNVSGRYQYGPFGRLSGMWGPMAAVNVMRFSSMPYHDKAGISSFAFRDYDPVLQRFLTQDPIGEAAGINLYGFVGNSPLNEIDPYGLLGWRDFNPGLVLDKEVHQGLLSLLSGVNGNALRLNPHSNRALLNAEGLTEGRLVDEEGNSYTGGQLLTVGAGAVTAAVLAEVVDAYNPLDEISDINKLRRLKKCEKRFPTIRNKDLAGMSHPKTGIPFDKEGFPDFSSVSKKDVKIEFTGDRDADFLVADKAAGFKERPPGYTWHHHQDGTTMQLVPTDIHSKTGHTGGFSLFGL